MSLLAAALLAVIVPGPASAADSTPVCQTVLQSTPGVTADIDGDGYPEYRVPRIYDVVLCSEAGASYVTYPLRTEPCMAGWHPTCMAVRFNVVPAEADAGASADLCYTIEGLGRSCHSVDTLPVPWPAPQVVCIGYDLNGGHPCGGSVFALE